MRIWAVIFGVFVGAASGSGAAQEPVNLFAAASLQGALEEIAALQDTPVSHSYAGSGTIARQIAAGAPADLVVLASPVWMEWLKAQGHLGDAPPTPIAGNHIVVIGPKDAPPLAQGIDIASKLDGGRLAMGHREAVPAGTYARQWLEHSGQWAALQDHLAETDNVRAALALVARGQAPLGVVYATDAQAEADVATLFAIPSDTHDPITYPAAALTPRGAAYLAHLRSTAAQDIFARHGFTKGTQ